MCILHNRKYDGSNLYAYFKDEIKVKVSLLICITSCQQLRWGYSGIFRLCENILRVNTQGKIDTITNFVESFGYLLVVNDGYIDTFSKIPIMIIIPERLRKEY